MFRWQWGAMEGFGARERTVCPKESAALFRPRCEASATTLCRVCVCVYIFCATPGKGRGQEGYEQIPGVKHACPNQIRQKRRNR